MTKKQLIEWLDAHIDCDVTSELKFRENRVFALENIKAARKYGIEHPAIESLEKACNVQSRS